MSALTRPVCEVLGCSHPIVLAATGKVRRADRVAIVSRAGGFSLIDMAAASPDLIRAEIVQLSRLSNHTFGVTLNPASVERALLGQQIRAVLALGVSVIGFFSDPGAEVMRELSGRGAVVVRGAASVANAIAAERAGARVLVAPLTAGGGAGGGAGRLADIVAATKMPVLASGNLSEGHRAALALALGADGVIITMPELFLPLLTDTSRALGPEIRFDTDEAETLASPVCYLGELDDAAAGFADRDTLIAVFNRWLEASRAAIRTAPEDVGEIRWTGVLEAAILGLDGSPSRQSAPALGGGMTEQARSERASELRALLPKIRNESLRAALSAMFVQPQA